MPIDFDRLFNLPGETMIALKGGSHMSGQLFADLVELGLAEEGVQVMPQFAHHDVHAMGMGGVPADVQWRLGSVEVTATLIHYSQEVLETALDESMAAGGFRYGGDLPDGRLGNAGTLAPAGSLLGGRKEMYDSGNHFFSVNLIPGPLDQQPYRFRRCHLAKQPVVIPLGTDVQKVRVTFRALPYADPYRSGVYSGFDPDLLHEPYQIFRGPDVFVLTREPLGSGSVLWDRKLDVSGVLADELGD